MFDANMSYLPKGHRFFAKVYTCSDKLKSMGIKNGDLIICHMLNEGSEDPCVDMLINNKLFSISGHKDFYDNWFVYEGRLDLTGFICDKSKAIAAKMISK